MLDALFLLATAALLAALALVREALRGALGDPV